MAIAVILDFPGGTKDQYDDVIKNMGLTRNGDAPPGAQFHWVAVSDDGIRVVDVWDSREVFDRFAQEQIIPLSREAGLPEPQLQFYDVYNTFASRELGQRKIDLTQDQAGATSQSASR